MGLIASLVRAKDRRLIEKSTGSPPIPTKWHEFWIVSPQGHKLYAHVHEPQADGKFPCAVFVPGGASAGTVYDGAGEIRADELASMGFVVIHYDPSGRGRSQGIEDNWGPAHQDELASVIEYSQQHPKARRGVIIVSFSIGISISAGALARHPDLPVRFIFDWEGPSNRKVITKNDTHKPLRRFPSADADFWSVREASGSMARVRCGYFRYQAEVDHVQGRSKAHAIELMNLATRGEAAWTRCNDNPDGTIFDEAHPELYHWVPGRLNHRGTMIKYIMEAAARESA